VRPHRLERLDPVEKGADRALAREDARLPMVGAHPLGQVSQLPRPSRPPTRRPSRSGATTHAALAGGANWRRRPWFASFQPVRQSGTLLDVTTDGIRLEEPTKEVQIRAEVNWLVELSGRDEDPFGGVQLRNERGFGLRW
jgi:hypothetical protein